jgi:hypothetical protein
LGVWVVGRDLFKLHSRALNGLRTFGEAWVVLQSTYGLSEHTGLFI